MIKSRRIGLGMKHHTEQRQKDMGMLSLAGVGVGGVIGAGLFLGSGLAIRQAGPGIVLAYLLGGLIMMQVLGAMTTVNVNRLEKGSFRVYADRFLGRYAGFLLGWAVLVSAILGIGSEAIAMAVFTRYWLPQIPLAVLALSFLGVVAALNLLGGQAFGKMELGMSAVKTGVLLLFIGLGAYALFLHGVFVDPHPFAGTAAFAPKGVSGILAAMLIVIFSYSGIEAVAMASTEAKEPRKNIPRAAWLMALSIISLYTVAMGVLVMLTPWKTVYTEKSPFVQAMDGIDLAWASTGLNFIILVAAFSVMAATYFTAMHLLTSLAESKEAPHFFLTTTKKGFLRNGWLAIGGASLLVVGLSFLLSDKLYGYLVAASAFFTFLSWGLNVWIYLVWRKRKGEEETFQSRLIWGKPGAYATLAAILGMAAFSLRVEEFRYGFYAAAGLLLAISVAYLIWKRKSTLSRAEK